MSTDAANVKVAVRVRPLGAAEGESNVIRAKGRTVTIEQPNSSQNDKTFTYDFAFGDASRQTEVYDALGKPVVDKAMQGYNCTVFAYGQTGSGKTYTMMSDADGSAPGIIPTLVADVFARIAAAKKKDESVQFLVVASYLEIYNEVVRDLLNPTDKQLKIREHPTMGIYVENLAELVCTSAHEVTKLLTQGNGIRKVAETKMNARSSRSHSCFTLRVERKTTVAQRVKAASGPGSAAGSAEPGQPQTRTIRLNAKINLVDLAGSERANRSGAEGQQLKEGAAINKSLHCLGNVINALSSPQTNAAGVNKPVHIPYRDSKLTRLLEESLGGNSLTTMVATVSPAASNYDQSLSTLKYANRAKDIKNAARRNEDQADRIIRSLREEINSLRLQLAKFVSAANGQGSGVLADPNGDADTGEAAAMALSREETDKVAAMEESLANLKRAKAQTWDEKQRLSRLYAAERTRTLGPSGNPSAKGSKERIFEVMAGSEAGNSKQSATRLRTLHAERGQLNREYRQKKEEYTVLKQSLQEDMDGYQKLMERLERAGAGAAGAAGKGPDMSLMEELLRTIQVKKKRVLAKREQLALVKKKLRANEGAQAQERTQAGVGGEEKSGKAAAGAGGDASAAAGTKVEDSATDADIALWTERESARIKEQDRVRRKAVAEKMIVGEQLELEIKLLEIQMLKDLADVQAKAQAQAHVLELKRVRREHKREMAEQHRDNLGTLRELCDCFEQERRSMESKFRETAQLLQQSVKDVMFFSKRTKDLERQLAVELSWEPPSH